ncbi:hypothetical protein PQQ51_24580 [Paraburkholderia xenovorans]|uniref:hypothetical protein n=1 Tax=Paraburkholderia xenovorans TaxID=36873 RepID=UPI0038BC8C9F
MNGRGFITISMHELERVKIIESVVQHRLTTVLAAERLQLSVHQINQLMTRHRLPDRLNHAPRSITDSRFSIFVYISISTHYNPQQRK